MITVNEKTKKQDSKRKKRYQCILIIILIIAICFATTASAVTFGDMNGDNKINVTDARLLLRHTVGIETISGKNTDMNNDGKTTVADARTLLRHAVGIEYLVEPTEYDTSNNTDSVYVTPSGKKYHILESCGGVNSSAISLSQAIAKGYEPCQKCAQ